ncbi:hypothetical protein CBI38_37325 (plasmid) [Rhodococcus oxybenzonivorans]|uniref:DUF8175 domain-containing protein n=1 Tax=Rhodococcus oxybenzonivorans TaxID=1990687 RepID=A0A2S2C857_9NOCA|nr:MULTISPECIES: hypothetical protein [Rhodococcus]AWK77050.1 hypothetical protein CBI38_37325 [Rhodococcus oxybenzonivorans]QTJ71251.1 hypothetical protein HYG77_38020 [Rhodococcus sp. ZPP]
MRTIGRRSVTALVLAATVLAASAGCGSEPDTSDPVVPPVDTTTAPAHLSWESYNGVRLPRSPEDGPKTTSTIPSGYSNTPQGAVLAAIRGQAYLALTPDTSWGQMVSVVTAPGPGRDEFAANRALVSVTGPVPAEQAPKFIAFKVTEYTPGDSATAAVDVVQEIGSPPARFVYPVALQWIGDWRLVLPTAAENVDAREAHSLDGYTLIEEKS